MVEQFQKLTVVGKEAVIPNGEIDDDMTANLTVKDGVINFDGSYLPEGGYDIPFGNETGTWQIDSTHVAQGRSGDDIVIGKITVTIHLHKDDPRKPTISITGDHVINRDIMLEDGEVVATGTFIG